jgi:hypothetical protein
MGLLGDVMSDDTIAGYNRNQVQQRMLIRPPCLGKIEHKQLAKQQATPEHLKKELILLGTGPSHKQCPYDCEVWTMNDGFQSLEPKRLDKLFFFEQEYWTLAFPWGKDSTLKTNELRGLGVQITPHVAINSGIKSRIITPKVLDDLNIPIVSFWAAPGVKKFEPYPLWDIVSYFKSDYFTNSFAYMMAYAIWLGCYKKIRLYGVDMSANHELYRNERGGVEFWIGVAIGSGIEVEISKGSSVAQRNFYGLESNYHPSTQPIPATRSIKF